MAEKISIEIGLDGGAEVERQLEDIGKSGQKAFSDIQNAAEQVNLDSATEQFDNLGSAGQAAFEKVKTAARSAAAFEQIVQGIGKVEDAFEGLGNAVSKVATRMTRSLGVFGVFARGLGPLGIALGVASGAFLKFGDSAADALNKLTGEGAKLGLTAQQMDIFEKALTRLGVSPDAIIPGLQRLGEVWGGNLFRSMEAFIAQLERMPDSVQRTQLAMQTLDDSLGAQVIAGLQTGTISAQKFASALAGVSPATQQQLVDAAKYQQAINQLSAAWRQFITLIASPITTPFLKNLTADLARITEELAVVAAGFRLLTAPVAEQAARAKEVVKAWEDVGKSAREAAGQSARGMNAASQATENFIGKLNTAQTQAAEIKPLTGLFDKIATDAGFAGEQAGRNLDSGIREGTSNTKPYLTGLFDKLPTDAQQAGDQAGTALASGTSTSVNRVAQELAKLQAAWAGINGAAAQSIETMRNGLAQTAADAQNAEQAIIRIGDAWVDASGPGHGTPGVGSGTPGVGRFAAGGFIAGRGTGTSDSNLAWVSRGEHIMPARAVGQPGVLSFLEALRRSGGNLSRVLDGLGHFALGGVVPRSIPAFAGGGMVGGGANLGTLTLGLPSGGSVSVRASANVVEQLHREAALAQVRSGGRKPSRYS